MDIPTQFASSIHPDLEKTANKIQESEIGTLVLGANYLNLDSFVIEMDLQVQEPKKLNILEEFVLKAIQQFKPSPTPAELSRVLGLDILFINDAIQNLTLAGIIKNDVANHFVFTDAGKRYFKDGYYPTEKVVPGVKFIFVAPLSSLIWIPKLPEHLALYFEKVTTLEKDPAVAKITLKKTIDSLIEDGAGIHSPEIGHRVTAILDTRQLSIGKLPYPAYLLLDKFKFSKMEDDNLSIRLFNPIRNQRDFILEDQLTNLLKKLKIELKDIFPAAFSSRAEASVKFEETDTQPEYKKAVLEQYEFEQSEKQKPTQIDLPEKTNIKQGDETIEFLFAEEIRTRWIKTLRETKNIATIITPWVNEDVIDHEMLEDFKKLARKKILINIGWGFSPTIEKEEKPIKASLLSKLHQIKTPDDLPAINVFYIGNMHNKDFVADRRIHISGSHNYLSYRGDRHPRAESAYYVINQTTVQKALNKFDDLFDRSIKGSWNDCIQTSNQEGLIRCCVAWTCIYRPKTALREIHNLLLAKKESIDPLLVDNTFKAVFKSLIQLPRNDASIELIIHVIETLGMYGFPANFYAKNNNKYIQDWIDYMCTNPEAKKFISPQRKFLKSYNLSIPDKL